METQVVTDVQRGQGKGNMARGQETRGEKRAGQVAHMLSRVLQQQPCSTGSWGVHHTRREAVGTVRLEQCPASAWKPWLPAAASTRSVSSMR